MKALAMPFRKGHGSATTGPLAIKRRDPGAGESLGDGSFMTVRHQVH